MNTMEIVPQFTDQEKRFVLAEAIKTSSVPVEKLLVLFNDGSVQPVWHQMLLPHGRNLQSCMNAFDALRSSQPPPFPSFQGPVSVSAPKHQGGKRKSAPESLEPTATGSAKRRQPDMTQHILPKPSNGSPGFNPSQNPVQPKKRGRPSKATVEQRQAEAIARGEVIAPPKTSTPKPEIQAGGESVSTPVYTAIAPMVSPRPPPSPMPPASFESPQLANREADSPGKRKRAKPAPKSSKTPKPGESTFPAINSLLGQPEKPDSPAAVSTSKETVPISQSGESVKPQTTQPIQSQPPAAAGTQARSDV